MNYKEAIKRNSDRSRSFKDVVIPTRKFGGKTFEIAPIPGKNTKLQAKKFAEWKYVPMGYLYRIVKEYDGWQIYLRKR